MLQASGMVAYVVNNGDDLTAVLSQNKKRPGEFSIT
jgi:hypothetical protein